MRSNSSNEQKCNFCDISIESRLSLIQHINTSYLTDTNIVFTLKVESVPRIKIFDLEVV